VIAQATAVQRCTGIELPHWVQQWNISHPVNGKGIWTLTKYWLLQVFFCLILRVKNILWLSRKMD
jgi:hypothetical protein